MHLNIKGPSTDCTHDQPTNQPVKKQKGAFKVGSLQTNSDNVIWVNLV